MDNHWAGLFLVVIKNLKNKNTQQQNTFDLMLLTHHFAKESYSEFIERDDGYLAATDNLTAYFAPYNEWPPRMQQVMEFVHGCLLHVWTLTLTALPSTCRNRSHEVVGH